MFKRLIRRSPSRSRTIDGPDDTGVVFLRLPFDPYLAGAFPANP
jgi:hypothetical protein